MDIELFNYELPAELIAQTPLINRTESRLLTLNKETGIIDHRTFTDWIDYLNAGDTIVLNDTKVIPARLFGVKKDTGAKVEVLLLKEHGDDRWEALVRPGKKVKVGTVIVFGTDPLEENSSSLLTATIEEEKEMGGRILRFEYEGIFPEILDRLGHMPLPPYIKEQLSDKNRYQTVYAKYAGSAAAPTAGLHLTESYIKKLEEKGINIGYVTLHVGLGTFRPVSSDTIEQHEMHEEFYQLPEETARLVNETKGRVIAVGTTSVRVLETVAAKWDGKLKATEGWTSIFIYPGSRFHIVDALLTNFHLPKSTLLMLISALAGRESVLQAYREAVEQKYRFFSFGDAMFIY